MICRNAVGHSRCSACRGRSVARRRTPCCRLMPSVPPTTDHLDVPSNTATSFSCTTHEVTTSRVLVLRRAAVDCCMLPSASRPPVMPPAPPAVPHGTPLLPPWPRVIGPAPGCCRQSLPRRVRSSCPGHAAPPAAPAPAADRGPDHRSYRPGQQSLRRPPGGPLRPTVVLPRPRR